jgi:hypothetical protein
MRTLDELLREQDGLITRRQALQWLSETTLDFRLGRHWQVVLPGVYAAHTGPVTDRQLARAALLWGGDEAMLTDLSALSGYGCKYLPDEPGQRILVPASTQRQSRDFVIVRRTVHVPKPVLRAGLRLAPLSRALTDFALRYPEIRTVRAVLSAAVQRGASTTQLWEEYERASARGKRRLKLLLDELQEGVRSAPEAEVRELFATSRILPTPLFNCLLELPTGRRISPDALIEDAGLVHETNGRDVHVDQDPFESMQERHDAMTAAGLTVLHNSPRMLRRNRQRVLQQVEACYLRLAGRGLPPGVRILRRRAM